MRSSCVSCHNSHPDTPKRDWKIGDLRGVLEVQVPLAHAKNIAKKNTKEFFFVLSAIALLGLASLYLVFRRIRYETDSLETEVQKRTSDLERMNTDLISSRKKYRDLYDNAPDMYLSIDYHSGEIMRWNKTFLKKTGYTEDELHGLESSRLFQDLNQGYFQNYCNNLDSSASSLAREDIELRILKKDGKGVEVSVNISCPGEVASNETAHNVSLHEIRLAARDISARKNLERDLLQAQKLESVGQLAAGIAHEINTPIQYVRDNTVFLIEEFDNISAALERYRGCAEKYTPESQVEALKSELKKIESDLEVDYLVSEIPVALKQSLDGAESVATIVRAMKDFSHPGSKEKSLVDLNKAVESTITVARNEWKYVAEIELDLAPSLTPIPAFAGEINQILLNLIVNAAHAIGEAKEKRGVGIGTITIKTQEVTDGVELCIKDTGVGIPKNIVDRIFDPFFTTKEIGKGTGQGLSFVHRAVIQGHGGKINVETREGQGTAFILWFPFEDPQN